MTISRAQIKEWVSNPLTKAYLKALVHKKEQENIALINSEEGGIKDAILKGKIKAIEEILDVEEILEGEDDQDN